MDRCNGGTSAAPPSSTPANPSSASNPATPNSSNNNNGNTAAAALAATTSNNGVKLRPVSSVDSGPPTTVSTSIGVGGAGGAYRRSFHRSGPGSASATSDYSMSTLAESVQDDQMSTTSSTPHPPHHLHSNGSGPGHGHGGHHHHAHGHHLLAGGSGHNTPGLPGSNLTQAGLEEYSRSYYEQTTMYHHQKQSSYAQSEGYHSYVSSSDSSSTPFLDRLRQDSELLLSRSSHNWSQQDLQLQLSASSNSIADNNSSESTSSTETLKWLGSMSDVSEASHATSMSALSSAGSTSQLIAHSARVRTPQRHNSESILFMTAEEQQQLQQQQLNQLTGSSHHSASQSMGSLHHVHVHGHHQQQQQNPVSPGSAVHLHQSSSSSGSSSGSPVGEDLRFQHRTTSNTSLASSASAPAGSAGGNGNSNGNSVNGSVRSSRSNNRLFPISTYTEIPSNVSSSSSNNNGTGVPTTPIGQQPPPMVDGSKQLSPHNWQSVADRINELEKHTGTSSSSNNNPNVSVKNLSHSTGGVTANSTAKPSPQKYTYFDPSKTHRVSNPSLKAFQKNAVISYFERQQAHARESSHNLSRPTTLNLGQQQSSGSPPSLKSVSQRSSISSAYSSSGSTMDLTPSSHPGGIYHHHPSLQASIAAQQQLDKIAANNLRNQLASVHTMNLLNKVQSPQQQQQHLESQMISNATLILANSTMDTDCNGNPAEDPLDANGSPPPPPPRSARSIGINNAAVAAATHAAHLATVRRTSSASEYSSIRDKMIQQRQTLSKDLFGPMIMGPTIALDDWVPERPPKNPMLRIPSPELPPPPMMSPTEDVLLINQDEPLPPPPPEILRHIRQLSDSGEPKSSAASRRNSFAGQTNKKSLYRASTFENLSPPPPGAPPPQQISQLIIPPVVPKKPQQSAVVVVEPQVMYRRSSSSMSSKPQSQAASSLHQAHRVQVNGKSADQQRHSLPMPLQQSIPQQQQFVPRQSDSRVSMRKRSHNSQQLPTAAMEYHLLKQLQAHNGPMVPSSTTTTTVANVTPPPPLKPRMPMQPLDVAATLNGAGQLISMGSKSCTGRREVQDYRVTDYNNNNNNNSSSNYVSSDEDTDDDEDGDGFVDCRRWGLASPVSTTGSMASMASSSSSSFGSTPREWLSYFGSKLHLPPMKKSLFLMSNSKASYLPRQQPRDKLHSDPDHGSYKLTLTSNEDSINHHNDVVFPEEIIATPTKCNLPDVLPPGVKYSLYSNNNNNNNHNSNSNGKMGKQLPPSKTVPHSAPIISANSLKSMFNFTPQQPQQNQVTPPSASSPVTPPPAYSTVATASASSQPGSPTNQQQAISPKYTSQSTFDLKKTQILDSKYLSQSPAQIGLPPVPPLPATTPNESINNTNYLNQQHSASNSCSISPNQQTVNNCNEFSEKADKLELNTAANTSTSTVEPAESNHHNTNEPQSSPPPYCELNDSTAPKEEEDRTICSSSSTSTSAEANQHQHYQSESPQQSSTTCSSGVDSTVAIPVLECVTKEISLEAPFSPSEPPSSPKVLQRTEIVLRVAAPTTEAASQTDDDLEASSTTSSTPRSPRSPPATLSLGISELVLDQGTFVTRHSVATSTSNSPTGSPRSPPSTPTAPNGTGKTFFSKACTAAPRKVHPEEIDCDKLSHDLILQLSPSDKLHTILAPKTFKSSSDYVSDLFNIQIAPRPMKKDASTATAEASPQKSPLDILTTSSTYFQVSEPKAKLMTRYSREMTLINGDCCDLTKKKEELVQRLGKKLLVLSNEQTSIAEESNANDLLGADVALKVAQKCRPSDASKFRSYVDDVGYITMLLLSLSGRLARTDNALHTIAADDSHPDKKILEAKRDRLLEQLDEAKQLKDDIDRRGTIISKVLEKSLTIEEYADYDYFINMKAKLIVDSREIADKIKLGEEQLVALKDTLVQSEC